MSGVFGEVGVRGENDGRKRDVSEYTLSKEGWVVSGKRGCKGSWTGREGSRELDHSKRSKKSRYEFVEKGVLWKDLR